MRLFEIKKMYEQTDEVPEESFDSSEPMTLNDDPVFGYDPEDFVMSTQETNEILGKFTGDSYA